MQKMSVNQCPCCPDDRLKRLDVSASQVLAERFLQLSREKYSGFMHGWEGEFSLQLFQCAGCGHIWHAEHPDQESLFGMYAHGRRMRVTSADRPPTNRMCREMQQFARLIGKRHLDQDLLDFGSGAGRWSVAADLAGFQVTGYEPSAARIPSQSRIRQVTDLGELEGAQFSAVNLEQVLEHVPDPVGLLQTIKSLMRPGGVLRISVPDICKHLNGTWLEDYPFNGREMHIMSPFEHLHGFTRKSLISLIGRSGWRVVSGFDLLSASPLLFSRYFLSSSGFPISRTLLFVETQEC